MLTNVPAVGRRMKPYADSTLRNMRKDELVRYIRCLENNYNAVVVFSENQARYIKSAGISGVIRCKECTHWEHKGEGVGECRHTRFAIPGTCSPSMDAEEYCCLGERGNQ